MKSFIPNISILLITTVISGAAYAGFDFNDRASRQTVDVPVEKVTIDNSLSNPFEIIERDVAVSEANTLPISIIKKEDTKPKAVLHVFSKENKFNNSSYSSGIASTMIANDGYKNISVSTWKANEGEPLREVIDRWSIRADTSLVWSMAERKTVLESVSYFGEYEDALMHLFDKGMQGTVEGSLSYIDEENDEDDISDLAPVKSVVSSAVSYVAIEDINEEKAPSISSDEKKWKVKKKDSLKDVLSGWQEVGNYKLIWDYPSDVEVGEEMFVYGTIEEALNLLLDGYKTMDSRPVGSMYTDQRSGLVYLHVEEDK